VQFATAYTRKNPDALADEIRAMQLAADPDPLFVRTLNARRDVVFLNIPKA